MDSSSFIVEREQLRGRMHTARAALASGTQDHKLSIWTSVVPLAVHWGLFPWIQSKLMEGVGQFVSKTVRRIKS